MEREVKSPEEVVRCLRICTSDDLACTDYDWERCSYNKYLDGDDPFRCVDALMSDAADLIAAIYNNKTKG